MEIRYMVFEDLFHVANVRTRTINPKFDDKPFSSPPNLDHVTPGNVQGFSPWNVKYGLETGILSVEEVQKDAHDIFEKINWVHITVNVGNFSAQLREAGLEVLTPVRARDIRGPALKIKISFDVTSRGEDKFFWPSLTICERPAEEAKVTKVTHQETREWELIVAFTETIVKPRSIEITGSTSAKIAKWLQNFDGTIQESEEVVTKKINDKLAESNTALQAECWQEAHDKALSCQGLMDIATKCDVARRRYENIVPNFPSIGSQCLSNISLARLKLGDAEGAYKNCRQIKLRVLPQRCLFDAHLREAMAAVASNHFPNAYRRFKAAHKISPSHPQPREELMAFEEHLIRETDVKQGIKSDTAINLAILRDVTKLLRS